MVLTGCSWLQPEPPMTGTLKAMQSSNNIVDWQLSGKVGLRGDKLAESAYINWTQCGGDYTIKLTGALGQGAAQIFHQGDNTELRLRDRVVQGSDAQALLTEQLGWPIPVDQLVYWVRGLPAPNTRFRINAEANGFNQLGWQLYYPRTTAAAAYTLPEKVVAYHPKLNVTLIIRDWRLDNVCSSPTEQR